MKRLFLSIILMFLSGAVLLADFPLDAIKAGPRPNRQGYDLVFINVPMFKWQRDRAEVEDAGGRLIGTSTDIRQDGSQKTSRIRGIFLMNGNWKYKLKKAEPYHIKRANAEIIVERFARKPGANNGAVIGLKQARLEFSTEKDSQDILDMIAFIGGAAENTKDWLFDLDHYSSSFDKQLTDFQTAPEGYKDWYDVATIRIKTDDWLKTNRYIFSVKKAFQGPLAKRPFRIPEQVNWLPGAKNKEAARFGTNEVIRYMRRIFTDKYLMEAW